MNKYLIIAVYALFVSLYENAATAAVASVAENPFMHQESQDHPNSSLGIHNGDEVPSFSSVPYIAYLEYTTLGRAKFACGAVFISNEYLLTAAHCVDRDFPRYKDGYTVYYDGVNRKNLNTWKSVKILGWKTYPGYMIPVKVSNDVAMIKLASKVDYSVVPIQIMTPEDEKKYLNFGATYVDSYGWGRTKSGKSDSGKSDNLMHMNALLGSREQIREMASRRVNKNYRSRFMFGTISANGQVIDNGDSGGPLVANCDGKPCLIGITSWASNNGVTSFFTRLTNKNIQKWIITTMQKWN